MSKITIEIEYSDKLSEVQKGDVQELDLPEIVTLIQEGFTSGNIPSHNDEFFRNWSVKWED